jgi:hypothetical protein
VTVQKKLQKIWRIFIAAKSGFFSPRLPYISPCSYRHNTVTCTPFFLKTPSKKPQKQQKDPPHRRMKKNAKKRGKRNGAPEKIRTSDLQLRRLPLYPAELRARSSSLADRDSG